MKHKGAEQQYQVFICLIVPSNHHSLPVLIIARVRTEEMIWRATDEAEKRGKKVSMPGELVSGD